MAVYNDLREYIPSEYGTCVALGFFDGVHLGHQKVIRECVKQSNCRRSAVLTFPENPAKALSKPIPQLLTDNAKKARIMENLGAEDIIFADFVAVKDLSPEEFVRRILSEKLRAKTVCCGFNYHFGKNGEGDMKTLKELCGARGIDVYVCEPEEINGEQISSSRIRALIAAGEVEKASAMLGYPYAIESEISRGNRLGSEMGFPTINLSFQEGAAIPKCGVYASRVMIDGAVYRGATNIGVHPTVGAHPTPLCETFLPDFEGGELYGKTAVCELIRFIRKEMHFDSVEALKAQIAKDCEQIKKIHIKNTGGV